LLATRMQQPLSDRPLGLWYRLVVKTIRPPNAETSLRLSR
jgi:hypothetical protein